MTKHIVSALCAALVPCMFWLGGFDFDVRGSTAFGCALLTIGAYLMVVNYPGWDL